MGANTVRMDVKNVTTLHKSAILGYIFTEIWHFPLKNDKTDKPCHFSILKNSRLLRIGFDLSHVVVSNVVYVVKNVVKSVVKSVVVYIPPHPPPPPGPPQRGRGGGGGGGGGNIHHHTLHRTLHHIIPNFITIYSTQNMHTGCYYMFYTPYTHPTL